MARPAAPSSGPRLRPPLPPPLLVGLLLLLPAAAHAAVFEVTAADCLAPGGFKAAVDAANTSPGPDVINVAAGLEIDGASCGSGEFNLFPVEATGDVTIEGNGALFKGALEYVGSDGTINPSQPLCPSLVSSNVFVAITGGFLKVSGGAKVVVRKAAITQYQALARVTGGSSLTLEDVSATRIWAIVKCQTPAIDADASDVTLLRVYFSDFRNYGYLVPADPLSLGLGSIAGDSGGKLNIQDSDFEDLIGQGFIVWSGAPGVVNVVSSSMYLTGGLTILEGASANVVNSVWWVPDGIFAAGLEDRMQNGGGGDMKFTASTLYYGEMDCGRACQSAGSPPLLVRLPTAGGISFASTAVATNFPDDAQLPYFTAPGFTADAYTWIRPTNFQDAAALVAATSQPALLTGQPGLPSLQGPDDLYAMVTPVVGGVLVAAVPNAQTTNQLINPIDGSVILKDVFGAPRTDGANRDVGAVQVTFAPVLTLTGTGDGAASLAWTRPLDPPGGGAVTGYQVYSREKSSTGPWTLALEVTNPAKLTGEVKGLTNGQAYEFYVATIIGGTTDGAASNTVSGTPYGPMATPAPVITGGTPSGTIGASWPPSGTGGRTLDHYTFSYTPVGGTGTNAVNTKPPSVLLAGLPAKTAYTVCVAALATDGTASQPGCTVATSSPAVSLQLTPATQPSGCDSATITAADLLADPGQAASVSPPLPYKAAPGSYDLAVTAAGGGGATFVVAVTVVPCVPLCNSVTLTTAPGACEATLDPNAFVLPDTVGASATGIALAPKGNPFPVGRTSTGAVVTYSGGVTATTASECAVAVVDGEGPQIRPVDRCVSPKSHGYPKGRASKCFAASELATGTDNCGSEGLVFSVLRCSAAGRGDKKNGAAKKAAPCSVRGDGTGVCVSLQSSSHASSPLVVKATVRATDAAGNTAETVSTIKVYSKSNKSGGSSSCVRV